MADVEARRMAARRSSPRRPPPRACPQHSRSVSKRKARAERSFATASATSRWTTGLSRRVAAEARGVEVGGAETVERRVQPPVGVGVALHGKGGGHEQVLHRIGVAAGAAQSD